MQQVVGALVAPTDGVLEVVADSPVLLCAPDDVDALWSSVPAGATHVLLVGERRHEAHVRRHAALLSDRGLAVSWRCLPHGPAAVVVLAMQTAWADLDPGLLPAFLDELAARTWSGAWTTTVAHLAEPAPSLGQHLRSWVPGGGGFLVTLSGTPAVTPVTGAVPPAQPVMSRGSLLCAATKVPASALRSAVTLAGASDTVELPGLELDPRSRFGSARAVEMVALPADADVGLPDTASLPRCGVCDAAVPSQFCSYCHVRPALVTIDGGDPQ